MCSHGLDFDFVGLFMMFSIGGFILLSYSFDFVFLLCFLVVLNMLN